MILLIDNYDSFSYNLYQLIGEVCEDIRVIRNDELSVPEIEALSPRLIVLSPGPGKPADAGICTEVVKQLAGKIPIFGVCLGHQVICEAFGATVTYAKELMHGKTSEITVDTNSCLFHGFPETCTVARYHSLAADRDTVPQELRITGQTADGQVMAVEHARYPVYGVQFHPESVLTEMGAAMIRNLYENIERRNG
ncbi:MAG: aminodeoxychorismate/anthranilate synthase component II [bacterium]|nr:aminodeoxychorismate/anthranilate synthase component II [bacterium]